MKIPSLLKTVIYKCDLFSTNVGFRFKQEPQYATMTGGIISFILIIGFIGIFTNTGFDTINKVAIEVNQFKTVQSQPEYLSLNTTNNFYFAMGLTGIDMNNGIRYFDIVMTYRNYTSTSRIKQKVSLQPCQRQVWSQFENEQLLASYDSLNFKQWLCPPANRDFQFRGKYTSENFQFIKIGIEKCTSYANQTRRCANSTELSNFIADHEQFVLNMYFINTIINPKEKEFIKYYLEDKNYFPFTLTQGMAANLYIASYSVETDQSLWPMQALQNNYGGIVTETAQLFPYLVSNNQYIKMYLRKSNQEIHYKRSFQKIDQTLSYIGGLFSTLLSFLMIVCLYNQLSYELEIAKNIYKYDSQTLLDTNGFHFLSYLNYLLYSFLKMIGCQPKWKKMQHYDQSLIEVRKQMDIRLIFKKIFFTEQLADTLLSKQQLTALHLEDKLTMEKAEKIRQQYFLHKILLQEIQNCQKRKQQIMNNKESQQSGQQSSNAMQKELSEGISFRSEQIKSFSFTRKVEEQISQNNRDMSDQIKQNNEKKSYFKTQRDLITNSINSLYSNSNGEIYLKMIEIIQQLEFQESKGCDISKKILSKISPQLKNILMNEKSVINDGINLQYAYPQQSQHVTKKILKIKKLRNSKQKSKMEVTNFKQITDIIVLDESQNQKKLSHTPEVRSNR